MAALSPMVKAAELLRKSVEAMVRGFPLGSWRWGGKGYVADPPPPTRQYSIDSQTRSKAWVLQQMGTQTAEIDSFQQTLPPE